MLNLDILEKSLGIVPPTHIVYDFQEKCFSCYILLINKISLSFIPLLLEILGIMCIAIVCFIEFDFINFEINVSCFSTRPKI